MAGRLDDVFGVQRPGLCGAICPCALQGHCPALAAVVPQCRLDGGPHPYIQVQQLGVGLEKVGQLVLGGEDGPPVWEGNVWQMIVPDGIVQNKLVVSLAPIVADIVVGVNNESGHAEHLQSCVRGQTCLAGAYAMIEVFMSAYRILTHHTWPVAYPE